MKKLYLVLGFALFTAFLSFAQNQTINFDNLAVGGGAPINIVDGFDFNGWYAGNVPFGGYLNNKTSQPNIAFSPFETTPLGFSRVGDPFSLVSIQMGAGWNCGMNIRVNGFLNGGQVFEENVTVDATAPATDFAPGWGAVDEVVLTRTSPGNLCVGGGAGAHYTIDDVVVGPVGEVLKPLSGGTSVPTMTQWGLFLFGLIVVTLGVVYIYNMSVRTSTVEE